MPPRENREDRRVIPRRGAGTPEKREAFFQRRDACAGQELQPRTERGLKVVGEQLIPIFYKGRPLNGHYRIDLLVEDAVLVELKSIETVLPVHCAQVLTYLRLTEKSVGLLVNFNVSYLKQGVRRIVNDF